MAIYKFLCQIASSLKEIVFSILIFRTLDLSKMAACGVRRCENGEEFWMCVAIRYPMLPGLKLPEDEVIDIKCKPQDPAISGSNVINFQENV